MEQADRSETLFECAGIYKTFGGTKALQNARLGVRKGEVHALCGENGAGRSTLMNIIGGVSR
jgi:ribose transport system ATP-binding protein